MSKKPLKWLSALQTLAEEEFRRGGVFRNPPEEIKRTSERPDATKVKQAVGKKHKKHQTIRRSEGVRKAIRDLGEEFAAPWGYEKSVPAEAMTKKEKGKKDVVTERPSRRALFALRKKRKAREIA